MRKLQTQGMQYIALTGADVASTVNWPSRKKKAEHKARPSPTGRLKMMSN